MDGLVDDSKKEENHAQECQQTPGVHARDKSTLQSAENAYKPHRTIIAGSYHTRD